MPWKKLYESCVSETNPDKLKKLVFQLEDAIVLRYHDLIREPQSSLHKESGELQAIQRVAQQLRQLKIDNWAWPIPAVSAAAAIPASMAVSSSAAIPTPAPAFVDEVKELPAPVSRTFASRLQSALLTTQRAWQNWVFKSLK